MNTPQKISEVSSSYLQDSRSWILFPKKVKYSFSVDGINFSNDLVIENDVDPKNNEVTMKNFAKKISGNISARYIKVEAMYPGKLPEWHQGAGGDSFIFIDEIEIK